MATIAGVQMPINGKTSIAETYDMKLTRMFNARVAVSVLIIALVAALVGGAFTLEVRAQNTKAAIDAVQTNELEHVKLDKVEQDKRLDALRSEVENLKSDVATFRGALLLGGMLVGFMTFVNLVLTINEKLTTRKRRKDYGDDNEI